MIDFVEKVSSSKFGAFGNMCDDVKASSDKFVGREPLFAAAGYATILGRCAVFVGGGVHPKIIVDAVEQTKPLMADIEGNPEAMEICKQQAFALASTYVRNFTPEAAEVIISMGLKFERLVGDEMERISPEEVVLRARRIARGDAVARVDRPTDSRNERAESDSLLIGGPEFQQFKELSSDHRIVEHFISVCAGMSQVVPFDVKDRVQRMVGFAQSLISMTGLTLDDLVGCIESDDWSSVEERLRRTSTSLAPMVEKVRPALERLRSWADAQNLPALAPFESTAYQMTGFPRDLSAIFTLRQLHLPSAGLTALPEELAFLPALESICVDDNEIVSFPSSLFGLHSLRRIDAEGNQIEEIPDSIGQAKHLQAIDLDGNNLKRISPEISRCGALKRVYLRKQRHGTSLDRRDTPLSDDAMDALASLDARGVDVRF